MDDGEFRTLHEVLAGAWALLERATVDLRAAMRHPVLATKGLDDLPNARTVLLWRVESGERRLYFGTDRRSPKHVELERMPWALLVFYEPVVQTQLRIHARVRFRSADALTRQAWQETPPDTRRVFATPVPPGHVAPVPVAGPAIESINELPELDEAGYRNFELLEARALHLDWLRITPTGHRRAAFTWTDGDALQERWLYP